MITRSDELALRGSVLSGVASEFRRGEYFGGLFILGCVSGLTARTVQSIDRLGWADAFLNTFEVSAIVWISCIAGVSLVLRDQTRGMRPQELALGAGFVFLVVIPVGPLSWLAVTVLSLYILVSTDVRTSRRGALILLATTVPMLWSRMLFQFFANPLLAADASLVHWLLGTRRAGTFVEFADGSGWLAILPAAHHWRMFLSPFSVGRH